MLLRCETLSEAFYALVDHENKGQVNMYRTTVALTRSRYQMTDKYSLIGSSITCKETSVLSNGETNDTDTIPSHGRSKKIYVPEIHCSSLYLLIAQSNALIYFNQRKALSWFNASVVDIGGLMKDLGAGGYCGVQSTAEAFPPSIPKVHEGSEALQMRL